MCGQPSDSDGGQQQGKGHGGITTMTRGQISKVLDRYGPYQRRLMGLILLPLIVSGFKTMVVVITFLSPDHRCRVPGLDNDTFAIQNDAHRALVNLSIPMTSSDDDVTYAQCEVYKDRDEAHANRTLYDVTEPCDSWVYDVTDFDNTIVTQFDLVCEERGFRANFNMIYMLGLLAGSGVSGILCDRFGRKRMFLIGMVLSTVVSTVTAFPGIPEMLLVYRFMSSFFGSWFYLGLYVLCIEMVGPEDRTLAGSLMMIYWVFGPVFAGALAYVIRDWRWIQISVSPFIVLICYQWILDESPRWLKTRGREREATAIILKVMKVNKMTLPNDDLDDDAIKMDDLKQKKSAPTAEERESGVQQNNKDTDDNKKENGDAHMKDKSHSDSKVNDSKTTEGTPNNDKTKTSGQDKDTPTQTNNNNVPDLSTMESGGQKSSDKGGTTQENKERAADVEREIPAESIFKLFKYPNLIGRTGIIFFNWSAVSTTYYGLSLNVANLAGSVKLNFMLSNLVEFPAYFLAWFLLDRLGRQRSHCLFMFLAGLACVATVFSVMFGGHDLQWVTVLLVMVGKLGISAAFSTVYLMSGELFPTVVRNSGMGSSSMVARVATALSPYVADLSLHIEGPMGRALPLVIFGALALAAGLLALCLPETLHRKLPDTIEEAANFSKSTSDDTPEHVQHVTVRL